MKDIKSTSYNVYFQKDGYFHLNDYLEKKDYSKVVILVDENTKVHCLDHFLNQLPKGFSFDLICIQPGEEEKNISTCLKVWNRLTDIQADRKSVLINLGGGVITDLGGFVASTYKRGIDFINIPTSLLSMVDASVGSKTGIDLGTLKNLIGCFSDPELVLIDSTYLTTLTQREFNSGLAEIIKYGISYDPNLWQVIGSRMDRNDPDLEKLIYRSIEIKNEIVLQDLKESDLRKVLNFGHTLGHAIESYFLNHKKLESLTHGEAIGIGMIVEAYVSHTLFNFPIEEVQRLRQMILSLYGKTSIAAESYPEILELAKHDKKNIGQTLQFVLLEAIGNAKINCEVDQALLIKGLEYYDC